MEAPHADRGLANGENRNTVTQTLLIVVILQITY